MWASFSKTQYGGETALFKSTYGENWKKVGKGLPTGIASARMYGLSINENSPENRRTLYITVKGRVYKSIDDGENWKLILSAKKIGGLKFTQVDNNWESKIKFIYCHSSLVFLLLSGSHAF